MRIQFSSLGSLALAGLLASPLAAQTAGDMPASRAFVEARVGAAVPTFDIADVADMGLETVANPGPPAHKLAFGGDMEVGAAGRGRFGQFVQGNGPSIAGLQPLNPIRPRRAIPVPAVPPCKTWDSGKMRHKGLFPALRSS